MDNYDRIDIIKKAYSDTEFMLEYPKYTNGIRIILFRWILTVCISNSVLYLFAKILNYISFFGIDSLYKFHNVLFIILNGLPLIVYLSFIKNKNITLREKHFLKLFIVVPILMFVNKVIFPISFYYNFDFLLSLYDSISLELIAVIIGILMLYYFFKKGIYLYLSMLTFFFACFSSFIKIVIFGSNEINNFLIYIFNILDFINVYSVYSIFIFFCVIYFIPKNKYE